MDGGGHLARSLRQAGFKAVPILKMGVARAVAAWAGLQRLRARRRMPAPIARQPQSSSSRLIAQFERYLPRRAGAMLTFAVLLTSVWLGVVRGDHLAEVGEALDDVRNAVANAAGFQITAITITGRKQLSQEDVLAIGGITGRSSLLFLDAATVRDRLKANSWIADATVMKLYPGRLQIDVTERQAFALWQKDGAVSVIAEDGAILQPFISRRFTTLPLVVGVGADSAARYFLALLDQYPQVASQVRAAVYVGTRRWNLRLKNGLDVRLPEYDVGRALATLSRLDREDRLLSRDIVSVDMRLNDRLVVRLSDEAAKAREDLLKDKKPKRKANDA